MEAEEGEVGEEAAAMGGGFSLARAVQGGGYSTELLDSLCCRSREAEEIIVREGGGSHT